MSSVIMSAGDPPSGYPNLYDYHKFYDPFYGSYPINSSPPGWNEDISKRLAKLEKIIEQLGKEEKIRKKNFFIQELYDQYKVGLALLEDSEDKQV